MIQPSKGGVDGLMVMLFVLVTFHLVQFEYGIFGNLSALHPVELGQNSTEARYRLMLPNLLLYSVSTEQDSLRRVILPLPGSDYELYSYEPLQHYEWHQAKTIVGMALYSIVAMLFTTILLGGNNTPPCFSFASGLANGFACFWLARARFLEAACLVDHCDDIDTSLKLYTAFALLFLYGPPLLRATAEDYIILGRMIVLLAAVYVGLHLLGNIVVLLHGVPPDGATNGTHAADTP